MNRETKWDGVGWEILSLLLCRCRYCCCCCCWKCKRRVPFAIIVYCTRQRMKSYGEEERGWLVARVERKSISSPSCQLHKWFWYIPSIAQSRLSISRDWNQPNCMSWQGAMDESDMKDAFVYVRILLSSTSLVFSAHQHMCAHISIRIFEFFRSKQPLTCISIIRTEVAFAMAFPCSYSCAVTQFRMHIIQVEYYEPHDIFGWYGSTIMNHYWKLVELVVGKEVVVVLVAGENTGHDMMA